MAGELIYAFRVMRLPLLDAGGAHIGRLDDIVVIPPQLGMAPRVLGFVATSQRRRIFVNAAPHRRPRRRRRSAAQLGRRPEPVQAAPRRAADRPRHHRPQGRRRDGQRCRPAPGRRRPPDVVGGRQGAAGPAVGAAPPAQLPAARLRRGARRVRRRRPGWRDGRRGGPAARHAPQRRGRPSCGRCRWPTASSWPRRWTTSAWPTCSRSCRRPSSCASSKGSTSNG